jgi:hypothetical protein
MCAYKLCKAEFAYFGAQRRVESFIHEVGLRKTMLRAHRQVMTKPYAREPMMQAWCWLDEWCDLTVEEIRKREKETMVTSNAPAHLRCRNALQSHLIVVVPCSRHAGRGHRSPCSCCLHSLGCVSAGCSFCCCIPRPRADSAGNRQRRPCSRTKTRRSVFHPSSAFYFIPEVFRMASHDRIMVTSTEMNAKSSLMLFKRFSCHLSAHLDSHTIFRATLKSCLTTNCNEIQLMLTVAWTQCRFGSHRRRDHV